jgi:hypothetical protein
MKKKNKKQVTVRGRPLTGRGGVKEEVKKVNMVDILSIQE